MWACVLSARACPMERILNPAVQDGREGQVLRMRMLDERNDSLRPRPGATTRMRALERWGGRCRCRRRWFDELVYYLPVGNKQGTPHHRSNGRVGEVSSASGFPLGGSDEGMEMFRQILQSTLVIRLEFKFLRRISNLIIPVSPLNQNSFNIIPLTPL